MYCERKIIVQVTLVMRTVSVVSKLLFSGLSNDLTKGHILELFLAPVQLPFALMNIFWKYFACGCLLLLLILIIVPPKDLVLLVVPALSNLVYVMLRATMLQLRVLLGCNWCTR